MTQFSILRTPPAIQMVFFAMCVWAVSYFPFQPDVPAVLRWAVGMLTGFGGGILLFLSISRFRKQSTTVDPTDPYKTQNLVTQGIFSVTRNPMYVAMAAWLVTVCMVADTWIGLVFVVLFVKIITDHQIKAEEAAMTDLFGQDYVSYQRSTPRWLLGNAKS